MASAADRIETEAPAARLAVLIDGDNAQASVIDGILVEAAKLGETTVKRIYGDFTRANSALWKNVLHKHAIKPVQQFAFAAGKNATDAALIIDAMDLLYTRKFDGFCLVTSDSDFTGLATRLREEGLTVLGFGEQKTPEAFRNACHRFVFTENLRPQALAKLEAAEPKSRAAPPQTSPAHKPPESYPTKLMLLALEQTPKTDTWAPLARFGGFLNKQHPGFDPRVYGYKNLSSLVQSKTSPFVTEERAAPGQPTILYLRAK